MIPVVLGVFLAMWLSDYQTARSEQRFINRLIASIQAENQANAEQINGLLDKQQRTYDSLKYYSETDLTLLEIIIKVRGLSTPDINETSLNLLQASHMSLIEFPVLEKLGAIRAEHHNYEANQRILINFFYENTLNKSKDAKLTLSLVLFDLMEYERGMLARYEELNEILAE